MGRCYERPGATSAGTFRKRRRLAGHRSWEEIARNINLQDPDLIFLAAWAEMREGVAMKAVLSQTGFCGGAHLHGSRKNRLHADLDSNGWPQSGRRRALELIRKANAVHIAGDQHLATAIQHGIDEHRDGPWAFVVPAIVNTYYGRWWWPEDEQALTSESGLNLCLSG